MNKKHIGSSFEDFLKGEGTYEEISAQATMRVLAWHVFGTPLSSVGFRAQRDDPFPGRNVASATRDLILAKDI